MDTCWIGPQTKGYLRELLYFLQVGFFEINENNTDPSKYCSLLGWWLHCRNIHVWVGRRTYRFRWSVFSKQPTKQNARKATIRNGMSSNAAGVGGVRMFQQSELPSRRCKQLWRGFFTQQCPLVAKSQNTATSGIRGCCRDEECENDFRLIWNGFWRKHLGQAAQVTRQKYCKGFALGLKKKTKRKSLSSAQLPVIPGCHFQTWRCWVCWRRGRGLFGPWGCGSQTSGQGPGGWIVWSWRSLFLNSGSTSWEGGPVCSL